jgi:hypothetical protein
MKPVNERSENKSNNVLLFIERKKILINIRHGQTNQTMCESKFGIVNREVKICVIYYEARAPTRTRDTIRTP